MATRLDDVPPEEVATPPTSIAAPIVQGISHTIDEPELRNLNLLASASDLRTAESAHPAFAHVIDQMTSFEAQALAKVLGPALLGAQYAAAARIQLYANAEESVASSHRVAVHCITSSKRQVMTLCVQSAQRHHSEHRRRGQQLFRQAHDRLACATSSAYEA